MRMVGITELMPLPRLSSFPFACYAILYLRLSPDNHSLLSLSPRSCSLFAFRLCFLLLVPHLLTLVSHSLRCNPSLAFLSSISVVALCIGSVRCRSLLHVQTRLQHTQRRYQQGRVAIQFVSLERILCCRHSSSSVSLLWLGLKHTTLP